MKRVRMVVVITAVALIAFYALINYIDVKDDNGNKTIVVGFVYDGDESAPYTYNFIKAANKLKAYDFNGNVEVIEKSNIPEEKGEEAMNELIAEGCDVIITTSYGYQITAKEMAKKNPNIQFCEATGDNANEDPLPNYHTFMGEIYQGRYVTGIIAGMKLKEMIKDGVISKDQAKVGYIGAFPYPEVISGYTAFILGVRSVVPTATMDVYYTNTWTSYSLEKSYAEKLIDEGCVIISQHSDTIGPAVACEDASEHGKTVYHVGYNQSMTDVAPTTTLVSSRIDWSVYIVSAVEAVLAGDDIERHVGGNVHGNDICAGFDKGWVNILDINTHVAAKGTEEAVNEAIEALEKRQLTVFKGDYIGINPDDPEDKYDLNKGYIENENASAPSFHYILRDVVTVH